MCPFSFPFPTAITKTVELIYWFQKKNFYLYVEHFFLIGYLISKQAYCWVDPFKYLKPNSSLGKWVLRLPDLLVSELKLSPKFHKR